jgi:hypothetical protein
MNAITLTDLHRWCQQDNRTLAWRAGGDQSLASLPALLYEVCLRQKLALPDLSRMTWSRAPYHNEQHCYLVALIALVLSDGDANLSRTDRMVLLYAALFHDAWHPGDGLPDSINIPQAIRAFATHCGGQRAVVDEQFKIDVENAIRCTSYPFVRGPDTAVELYLRDADLLVMVHPARTVFLAGLGEELKTPSPLTETANADFLERCHLFTEPGKSLMQKYLFHARSRGQ